MSIAGRHPSAWIEPFSIWRRSGLRSARWGLVLFLLLLPAAVSAQPLNTSITPTNPSVVEGGSIAVTVSAIDCLTPQNQVTYRVTVDPLTTQGSDVGAPLPLIFSFGANVGFNQVIMVPTIDDATVEPDETFRIRVTPLPGQVLICVDAGSLIPVEVSVVATIVDNDVASSSLSIGDSSLLEGDTGTTNADFTVALTPAAPFTVTVAFATANGSASAGSDFQATSGTLIFNPGQTTQTVSVPVNGDSEVEPDETFFVDLSLADGATIVDGRGVGTIENDDEEVPPPGLSISDAQAVEGDAGTVAADFTVTLAPASSNAVTVSFQTADGTATAGSDYIASQGDLTFAPGETTKTVAVQVQGDTQVEPDETFFVDLSNPDGATLATARGEGTIENDDATQSTISILDASVVEGDSGARGLAFSVTLSAVTAAPVTFSYSTTNGTAQAGSDYSAASGSLALPAGQTSGQIVVSVLGDTEVEPDETFFVTLVSASLPIADGAARGTIRNDDEAAALAIERIGEAGRTGGPGHRLAFAVRVLRAGQPAPGVEVTWRVVGDATLLAGEISTSQPPDGVASKEVQLGEAAGAVEIRALVPGQGDPVAFQVTVQPPFDSLFSSTESGQPVAAALDTACRGADGEFAEVCQYLRELGDPALQRQAISALVPDQVPAMGALGLNAAATQLRQLFNLMKRRRASPARRGLRQVETRVSLLGLDVGRTGKAIRTYRGEQARLDRAIEAALTPRMHAGAMPLAQSVEPAVAASVELESRWGLFVSGTISDGDRPQTGQEKGFDFQTDGLTAGIDYGVSGRFSLGAAVGYLNTESDFTDGGTLAVDGLSLSGFASYGWESVYLDLVASIGRNDYELGRAIRLPLPFQGQSRVTAFGAPEGEQAGLALALGGDRSFGPATLGGFTRLAYLDSTIDRFRENGAGPLALEIEEQEITSLLLEVGFEWSRAASFSWGVLQPQLRASYLREFEDDSRLLRARFVADRSFTEFAIPTNGPDRDFFNVGAGFTALFAHGWSCYLFYEQDFSREDLDSQALSGGFRVEL